MPESHVIAGVIAKRADLAGQVAHAEGEMRKLKTALEHVDATIVLFVPSIKRAGTSAAAGCRNIASAELPY